MASRRRILIRVGIVLAILGAAHIAWTYIEKRAFEQRIADLRAAKQPLYTSDLATVPVPDEKNAAALLEEAAAWLEEHRDTDRDLDLSSGLDKGAQYCAEFWDEEDWEKITTYLEALAPYYAMVEKIPERPRWWLDLAWEDGPNARIRAIPQVTEVLEYTRYRVAFDRVEAGRTERAARAAVFLLDLADRCELPFALGHLVVESLRAPDEILRLAEEQPGFDARLFREIVDPPLARTLRQLGPPAGVVKHERTSALWVVRAWLAGDSTGLYDDHIERNALWRPMLYRDACRALDMLDRVVGACGTRPEEAHVVSERLWEEREEVSITCPLTRTFGLLSTKLFIEYTRSTAKHRMTRVVMALLEYRQTHGRAGRFSTSAAARAHVPARPTRDPGSCSSWTN